MIRWRYRKNPVGAPAGFRRFTVGVKPVKIISFGYRAKGKVPPHADLTLDARHLANPHDEPGLRPRRGTEATVQDWLLDQPGTIDFINDAAAKARAMHPAAIAVGCNAGRHRSVAIAEILALRLNAEVEHRDLDVKSRRVKKSTAQRGYDGRHQQARKTLLYRLVDGEKCQICARPMFKMAENNFDGAPLEADHREGDKSRPPYRLLHRHCNRSIANHWVEYGTAFLASERGQEGASRPDWEGGRVVAWS